ncbi:hypothetical protein HY373_01955 [Candidatus Berkelbacteria bacterium]|nr:hypothetical protein [Candidatus Berkelbacteria bacterium]
MAEEAKETEVGKITHYYTHLDVAILELKGALKIGDKIHIKGHTSDFTQEVNSIQVEHQPVEEAKSGDVVGLKVNEHAREGDSVFKIAEA